jgi:hypothetical protein
MQLNTFGKVRPRSSTNVRHPPPRHACKLGGVVSTLSVVLKELLASSLSLIRPRASAVAATLCVPLLADHVPEPAGPSVDAAVTDAPGATSVISCHRVEMSLPTLVR